MHRIEVKVTGETGVGKTVILAAIDRALKDLGVKMILSQELEQERNMGNPDKPAQWELESLIKGSYVVLSEENIPRSPR